MNPLRWFCSPTVRALDDLLRQSPESWSASLGDGTSEMQLRYGTTERFGVVFTLGDKGVPIPAAVRSNTVAYVGPFNWFERRLMRRAITSWFNWLDVQIKKVLFT